ncbi:hypothetical protein [Pontiella sp.]|uniref:hypothetical protein n=1 Tax=Pontiella sp. TaxID=2837462 RepID=UPI003565A4ED
MMKYSMKEEVVVHPVDGMQLTEGYIREDGAAHYRGCLPGLEPEAGDTIEDVLLRLARKAKAYYGDDVVVELVPHHA